VIEQKPHQGQWCERLLTMNLIQPISAIEVTGEAIHNDRTSYCPVIFFVCNG
jgi:hypothetical protein